MTKLKPSRYFATLILLLISFAAFAQNGKNLMRDNGRIYVVVAVMTAILLGLILYMVRLDRKISRLEKETGHKS